MSSLGSSMPADINANESARPLATAIISIVFSGLFYAGRLYSRHLTNQRLDSSDYLLLFGMLTAWGINANIIYCSSHLLISTLIFELPVW
jgi:hypothetical protein